MLSWQRVLISAWIVGACAACSDVPPPPLKRVELIRVVEKETPTQDVQRSRASLARVLSDVRDAWSTPLGTPIERSIDTVGALELRSAAGIWVEDLGRATPDTRVEYEIPPARVRFDVFSASDSRPVASAESTLLEAVRGWVRLDARLAGGGDHDLVFVANWVGDPPTRAERFHAAFVPPLGLGLSGEQPEGAPNVLIVSVDTLRADRLGCYGYARPTSPNIDRLAQRGVRFERAYSPAPWTLPSYASLFTAMWPSQHRAGIVSEREEAWLDDVPAKGRTTEALRPDLPTLAEAFSARGYATGGFYCNPFLSPRGGLDRGFQQYTHYQYNAKVGVDLATQWIDARQKRPWFLFLHLIDPHMPYAPPSPFDERFAKKSVESLSNYPPSLDDLRRSIPNEDQRKLLSDLYDGEVAFADEQIGRLIAFLEARGEMQNTLIVFHSDHGEEFWEHGGCDHGHSQHEELLRVPLLISWPGKVPAQKSINAAVRALDVFPTLCELVGIEAPRDTNGQSLVPAMTADWAADRDVIGEAILWGQVEIKTLIQGRHKLIATGSIHDRLFDLSKDPSELDDRREADPELARGMRNFLQEHYRRAKSAAKRSGALQHTPQERIQLDGIGYTR